MKKSVMTIALIMLSFVSFAQKTKEQNVPQVIKKALSEKFPNAKNVKWDKEENNFEASFKNNNIDNSILFNANGKIIETEIAIEVNQLPKNALQYLNDNFKNKKIKETAKIITEKGDTIYEAEIKGNDLFFDENGNFITKDKVS
ncbi:MAG: hypothetical protein A3G95_02815 [Flavobacteria bacterium RIFCSPLOWO2_12_FULL_31_7]|nr:MAG: hypothetical protein A3G95_02815 [Flavobacteria bacterium RIFCSPLOWO2_12_FULL_31_7]